MAAPDGHHGRGQLAAGIGLLLAAVAVLAVLLWLRRRPEEPSQPTPGKPASGPALRVMDPGGPGATGTGAISGRVLGPDGAGLLGAAVVARRYPGREDRFPGLEHPPVLRRSERDGRFRFDGLPAGDYSVAASAAGLLGAAQAGIPIAGGAEVGGVELRLVQGGVTVTGLVSDASGGTISGARLLAERIGARPGGGVGEIGVFAAESDEGGRYRLQLVPGRYHLRASASGYTQAFVYQEVRAGENRDFRLEPAAHISGRVVTEPGGQPVAGAHVLAAPTEGRLRLAYGPAVTDETGAFRIDELPPDGYLLSARKGALVGRVLQPVVVASAGAAEDVRIAVSPGASISGTVRSQAGPPIAGAQVQVWSREPALARVVNTRVSSDRQGRFRLEGIAPGEHRLNVDAEGYISERIELAFSGTVTRDVVLTQGAQVTALVLDPSGRPAAGVRVGASTEGGGGDSDDGLTDVEGRFQFKRLEPGLLTVYAHQGDALGRFGPEPLALGAPRQVTVRLAPGARLSGKVLWDDGKPAAGVEIETHVPEEGTSAAGRSGPDGTFSLGPLFPGAISVAARLPDDVRSYGTEAGPEQVSLTLAPGEHRSGVALAVARRNGTIHGVVLGPEGQPLAGVVVQAAPERGGLPSPRFFVSRGDAAGGGRAITGGDGAFALEGLPPGTLTVWAAHRDLPEQARPGVPAGTRNLRIRLERGGALAGVVVTPDGRPLTTYQMSVTPSDEDEATPPQHRLYPRGVGEGIDVQDAKGAFRIERLPAGRYDVAAFTEEPQFGQLKGVTVKAGQTTQGLRLVTGDPPPNLGFVRAGENR